MFSGIHASKRLLPSGDCAMSALWLYLLLPPLGWLVVAFWPQGSERFGLQWQAFGFGIACACLLYTSDAADE